MMLKTKPRFRSAGFTIIELLVVIAVIGILMAILIPTIRGLFVRADDFVREHEIAQLEGALEVFKNEFGFYPPDFSTINSAADMLPYLAKISPNHQELTLDPVYAQFGGGTDSRLVVWWNVVGTRLKALPHETALWFWLSQLRDNAQFPLTGSRDPSNARIVIDERKVFFEFDQQRLHSIYWETIAGVDVHGVVYPQGVADADRYVLFHFDQGGGAEAPYVYFHNSSYGLACYEVFEIGNPISLGFVAPYRIPNNNLPPAQPAAADYRWGFYNPDSFQIICAGDDRVFGDINDPNEDQLSDFLDNNPVPANRLYGRNIQYRTQRDNVTNFSQGRIESMPVFSGL
ncbi:MAG TPA: prepilin-type N-terminal cleavage/methylation domain-containing protein [Pirellulaceae bacterium]|mgnify:CR=1 FL=1|nr:prepilin-type N-terminal cleavage/methylation domain-containing protein [Pirellulaceae bacterium]HMO90677.1 prepilin-type N-terminal cleavage/methylation domain-containing protein [Pirellulaceae bacterium]HMP67744.1 prepilin-type N-terminal cleavage/methylation domain-containing protein [Pirellulaceae bacterium]